MLHRGDVDDLAAASRLQPKLDEPAAAKERAVEVGADRPVPHVGGQLAHVLARRVDTGVVHQDVDTAERTDGLFEQRRHLILVADVDLHDRGPPSDLLDAPAGLVGAVGVVQVGDDDTGPFTGERDGDGLADAGVRAGDEGGLALESWCGHVISWLVDGDWSCGVEASDSRQAALMRPTWENACGKLPRSAPFATSPSSDSRPRSLA